MGLATSTDLESFLAVPAPGTLELHVTDALRPPTLKEQFVDDLWDEILDNDAATPENIPRVLEVAWVGPAGVGASLDLANTTEAHRAAILAARRLNVRIRYFHDDHTLGGTSRRSVGEQFGPRGPRSIGKLEPDARILDVADRFEVTITRIDRPGFVSRKVKRHKPFEDRFHVVQDRVSTTIELHRRKESASVTVANANVLGIANPGSKAVLFTLDEAHELPDLSYWSRVDFRGRDLAAWAYDRVLTRLGM